MSLCARFVAAIITVAAVLLAGAPAGAADIGVLSDGRQMEYLSLLGDSSGVARVTLQQDGHTINVLPALDPGLMAMVDIVWLPLLESDHSYTLQERLWLYSFVLGGGRIIWIGDADVFNVADDSFLATFSTLGLSKLDEANLTATLAPAIADHAVITGPHGTVNAVATNAQYGLFHSATEVADVFVGVNGQSESGTFAGFMEPSTNPDFAGRVAFICDTDFHGQLLAQDDHEAFLRNIMKWVEAAPGYTPSGTQVSTGDIPSACEACITVELVFETVTATGETTVSLIGSGRCGFDGVDQARLPLNFLGHGFIAESSATFPDPTDIDITVAYDEAVLTSLGIDEAALQLFWDDPDAGSAVNITATLDTVANTITGSATGLGSFLLGAIIEAEDCNENAVPDQCDTDAADPDGNGEVSEDCNDNDIPDECEIDENSTAPGGPFFCEADCVPDCNNNGVPDSCDIADATSQDCNDNEIPDECETGLTPEITQQPTNQAACEGGSVTFTVSAAGPGELSYQWRKNDIDISGATDTEYTVDPVSEGDAGAYDVVVANVCGSVTSDDATLMILEGPTITEHPADQDVCEGDSVSFSVDATGTGDLTYQWKRDGDPLFDGGSVSGATTATLMLDPVNDNHAGVYSCEMTDECGSVESDDATLTVGTLLVVTENPVDAFVCPGGEAVFTVAATGTGVTYLWQYDGGGGFQSLSDGDDIAGSTTDTLTVSNVTEAASGLYRCHVVGTCGAPVTTEEAELTVGVDVQIETQPTDQSACPGDVVSFTATAIGTELNYEWQFDDGNGYQILEDGDGISGANTDTLTISDVTGDNQGQYHCVVSGSCGTQVTSDAAELTVGAFPEIITEPLDQSACPGDEVAFTVTASGTELTYQWQFDSGAGFTDLVDGDDVAGATSSTLTLSNVTEAAIGEYLCVISGNCGVPIDSEAAALTVGAEVTLESQPADRSACPGAEADFSIVATGSGLTYQWQFNGGTAFENLVDGEGISGATTEAVTIAAAGVQHEGLYRCIVVGTCGPAATSEAAMLTVTFGACDCNENGELDADDIAAGTSQDCNNNGVPDECDVDPADPDGNGQVSDDCNQNDIPDECDLDPTDPDGNGQVSEDCNANGAPDECEIDEGSTAPGGPFFCQADCEPDCNDNGMPDSCDVAGGTSPDCNGNGVPDECDPPYIADAGEPFTICTGQASLPMGGEFVAVGSNPPYIYFWQVIAGPEDGGTLLSPTDERPRFVATEDGIYEIELVVSDSSLPPCVTTDTVLITATTMSVDAGDSFTMCSSATSAALAPTATGGIEPYSYLWTVEEGSPSTSPHQFTGGGQQTVNPTFTPDAPGQYHLRLTVMDANDPTCVTTDVLDIQVMQMAIEAGNDFSMCVSAESAALDLAVTAPGKEPLSYAWSIDVGSPNTNPSQFTGTGPNSQNPTFSPDALGEYVLRVVVRDSSTPPCEQTTIQRVTVGALTVDAGGEQTLCIGSNGVRLSPTVDGGVGGLTYIWSVEPGSPSVDPAQFTDPHNFDPSPLFVPSSLGNYTLRLTVIDSGTPPCTASDTITVRATSMTVDAGEDFITQAFQSSRQLGAIPVVGGGDGPFAYAWEIVGGPSRDASQLSDTNVEHPFFTPEMVGTHEIRVTVTDSNGIGCGVSDTVLVQAIASTLTLPVNVEGRLFMTLQIDAPHTRGEIRIADGLPGAEVTGNLYDGGPGANFDGLVPTPNLTRRLYVSSGLEPGSYIAVVVLYYDDAELAGVDEHVLSVHRFVSGQEIWQLAGAAQSEKGPFPVRATHSDLGRRGIDTSRNCVWAVVDYLGEFSIGISSDDAKPVTESENADAGTPDDGTPGADTPPAETPATGEFPDPQDGSLDTQGGAAMCGAVGPSGAGALLLCCLARVTRVRHFRRRL